MKKIYSSDFKLLENKLKEQEKYISEKGKFKYNTGSVDYLYMNIPDFKTEFFSVTPVSAFDGTAAGDALAPNPAGTFTIAPGATCQLFISVTAPDHAAEGKGQLVIDSVAGHKFESVILPVNFSVSNDKLLPEVKPITFGWDYMHEPMMKDRQEYTRKHYQMLKDYGFNTTMVSNLRHLPRPKASADGRIPAKLDFSRLRQQLDIIGKFDYYYLDIAIWNQKLQNKELFYLDFYDPAYATAFRSWFKQVLAELASHGINSGNLLVCPIVNTTFAVSAASKVYFNANVPSTTIDLLLNAAVAPVKISVAGNV